MSKEKGNGSGGEARPGHLNAILDRGTEYEGKLSFEGSVLINGRFTGEITSSDHLIVGEHGTVNGEIEVGSLQLSGQVTGRVRATQRVEILSTGRFDGDLIVPPQALKVEPGAQFSGTCKMEAARSSSSTGASAPAQSGPADNKK